jgi:hypothetical protein
MGPRELFLTLWQIKNRRFGVRENEVDLRLMFALYRGMVATGTYEYLGL